MSVYYFKNKNLLFTLAPLKNFMPQFYAEINVMPHKALLDPQGKAVLMGLKNLNITNVEDVRIGKHIQLQIQAQDEKEAYQVAENACKNLLHNPIMETYEINVHLKK